MKLITSLIPFAFAYPENDLPTIGEIISNLKNGEQSWTAGENAKFSLSKTAADYEHLFGSLEIPSHLQLAQKPQSYYDAMNIADDDIPASFDPREQWGDICPSLLEVRDQASCGSCWAFGAAEAFTDRLCISSNGQHTVDMSAEDLLSCCRTCGNGCNGGYTSAAWNYFYNTGVSTGGLYEGTGCKPYSISPCVHHTDATDRPNCEDEPMSPTPKCTSTCVDGYTVDSYTDDRIKSGSPFHISSVEKNIQKELMTNGPAEASFNVFDDFLAYTGGVYYHTTGRYHGGHAVKIMGWGVDEETDMPYWLLANSWNSDWGENGFFRMRRGTNECGIEASLYAA